jgi:hypothetical protein
MSNRESCPRNTPWKRCCHCCCPHTAKPPQSPAPSALRCGQSAPPDPFAAGHRWRVHPQPPAAPRQRRKAAELGLLAPARKRQPGAGQVVRHATSAPPTFRTSDSSALRCCSAECRSFSAASSCCCLSSAAATRSADAAAETWAAASCCRSSAANTSCEGPAQGCSAAQCSCTQAQAAWPAAAPCQPLQAGTGGATLAPACLRTSRLASSRCSRAFSSCSARRSPTVSRLTTACGGRAGGTRGPDGAQRQAAGQARVQPRLRCNIAKCTIQKHNTSASPAGAGAVHCSPAGRAWGCAAAPAVASSAAGHLVADLFGPRRKHERAVRLLRAVLGGGHAGDDGRLGVAACTGGKVRRSAPRHGLPVPFPAAKLTSTERWPALLQRRALEGCRPAAAHPATP